MRDLTATAEANADERRTSAEAVLAGDHSGRTTAFRALVATSVFSTTVTADKVLTYAQAGRLLDTRSMHVHREGGNLSNGLGAFAAEQHTWLPRREAFERLWQHGRRLLYGAVNAGGTGARGFGRFCLLVADPRSPPADALAVFPGDSAQRYTTASGEVDEHRCIEEATAWSSRADLAVTECRDEVVTTDEEDWPNVLCRGDRYLEVARAGELPVARLSETRLQAADRSRLDDLRAQVVAGETVTPVERNEVAAYDVLHAWRRSHGTPITEVS